MMETKATYNKSSIDSNQGSKKLEFQLSLRTSISKILLALDKS